MSKKSIATEAFFIGHCDFEECDMGSFQYTCPSCNKATNDYDIWWAADEIWKGKNVDFECEECKAKLVVKWNGSNYEYLVHLKETDKK
jgi:predicted SprT family Zn-dependent metalloprotease